MSDEKTLWEREIEEAEFGYPNNHFFEDVRYLTNVVADLLDIIEEKCDSDTLDEDTQGYIMWYFATKNDEKKSSKNPIKRKCDCNTKVLLNQGCQCGGE